MKQSNWVVESLKHNICAFDLPEKMASKLHKRYLKLGYADTILYEAESIYDILGGDGDSPVYGSEWLWYYPDGSTSDD